MGIAPSSDAGWIRTAAMAVRSGERNQETKFPSARAPRVSGEHVHQYELTFVSRLVVDRLVTSAAEYADGCIQARVRRLPRTLQLVRGGRASGTGRRLTSVRTQRVDDLAR